MRARFILTILVATTALGQGCGSSGTTATECAPVTCMLYCEHGFARGSDGCEVCACYEPPDDSCTSDDGCVLGVDYTDCCSCGSGYTSSRIAAEPCVVSYGDPPPPGCTRDPTCEGTACRCALAVRAICDSGRCIATDTCATGDVQHFGRCEPLCTAHADCVMAASYDSCCGGCEPHHAETVAADPCLAEAQAESTCSPGSCEGLGCASAPTDCRTFGGSAVCMESGECSQAATDGGCPVGFQEIDGRCVAQ